MFIAFSEDIFATLPSFASKRFFWIDNKINVNDANVNKIIVRLKLTISKVEEIKIKIIKSLIMLKKVSIYETEHPKEVLKLFNILLLLVLIWYSYVLNKTLLKADLLIVVAIEAFTKNIKSTKNNFIYEFIATKDINKINEGNKRALGSIIPKKFDISVTNGSSSAFTGSPIIVIKGITNITGKVSVMPFNNKIIVRRKSLYLLPSLPNLHKMSACFIR